MDISEKLPSRPDAIPAFVQEFLNKLKTLQLTNDELFDIKLCLNEALINAMKHGHQFDPRLFVEVRAQVKDDRLIIEVKDQGQGFDLKKFPNPTDTANLYKYSGRGVFLIKKLMDEVEHFDCGRGIKMVKFLKNMGGKT